MNDIQLPPKVSKAALEQIAKIGGDAPILRVAVDGGGCSGFQYRIELSEQSDDDLVLGGDKARVVIDPVSLPFLSGSVIDYKVELIGSRFVIDNPNAATSCGCGTSFSI